MSDNRRTPAFDNPWLAALAIGTVVTGFALLAVYNDHNAEPTINVHIAVFDAEWCSKCPSEAEVQELLDDYPNAEFVMVDVDRYADVAKHFDVGKRVPTFVIFNSGPDTTGETTRVYSLSALEKWLRENG